MLPRLPDRSKYLVASAVALIGLVFAQGPARSAGVLVACGALAALVCCRRDAAPPVGVWEWDPRTGNVTCPPKLLGFSNAERAAATRRTFTAAQIERIVHADDYERLTRIFQNVAIGDTPFDAEFRVTWPDGGVHWLVIQGKGRAGAVLDITPIRQPQAAIRESERRFRNAFEEAAVGMVILDVAGCVQHVNRGFTEILQFRRAR